MVSGIPPVGITQNKRFSSCDTVILGVEYVNGVIKSRKKIDSTSITKHWEMKSEHKILISETKKKRLI
jgi:hypothetical protein